MTLIQRSFVDLLKAFQSPAATPGGGSASALTGAVGAALLAMIGSMPKHRAASETDVDKLRAAARRGAELSDRLATLIDADAAAYERVVGAYKMPKESATEKAERSARIQQALREAIDVPLEVMRCAAQAIDLAAIVAILGNPNAASDVGVALELLGAAERGAKLNVEINLATVKDATYANEVRQQVVTLDQTCQQHSAAARARLAAAAQ